MSYGFIVRAATAAAAVAAAATKFDEVVATQPVHEKDRAAALATAEAVVGLIGAPEAGQQVQLSVNGWIQWNTPVQLGEVPEALTGASVTVSATIVAAEE